MIHRVVQNTPATIEWRPVNQHGEPATPSGTPTVVVTRADGTTISGLTPTTNDPVTLSLTTTHTADLDRLTIVWKLDTVTRGIDQVVISGGVYLTPYQLIETYSQLNQTQNTELRRYVAQVESWFERKCRRAFVPRFDIARISGDSAILEFCEIRSIEWVHNLDDDTAWSESEIAEIEIVGDERGMLRGEFGDGVTIGYTHGLDSPPDDILSAAMTAVRLQAASPRIRLEDLPYPVEGLGLDPDRQGMFGALKRWTWNMPVVA